MISGGYTSSKISIERRFENILICVVYYAMAITVDNKGNQNNPAWEYCG